MGILLIFGFFIPTTCAGASIQNQRAAIDFSTQGEQLDQSAPLGSEYLWTLWGENTMVAQAFRPKLPTLSRIELGLGRTYENAPGTYTVSIRDCLNGQDLTSKTMLTKELPLNTGDWISINFNDIQVTPNKRYFIVVTFDTANNTALVWYTANWNPYHRGAPWIYNDFKVPYWDLMFSLWLKFFDMSFRTYGLP